MYRIHVIQAHRICEWKTILTRERICSPVSTEVRQVQAQRLMSSLSSSPTRLIIAVNNESKFEEGDATDQSQQAPLMLSGTFYYYGILPLYPISKALLVVIDVTDYTHDTQHGLGVIRGVTDLKYSTKINQPKSFFNLVLSDSLSCC